MISLPYVLAALAATFVLGCSVGYINRDTAAKLSAAKSYKAAEEQRAELQGKIDVISAQYEATREAANRKSVERTNTIKEYYRDAPPVPSACALPDTMYGLLANAVRDANAAATGELSSNLPYPTTTPKPGY